MLSALSDPLLVPIFLFFLGLEPVFFFFLIGSPSFYTVKWTFIFSLAGYLFLLLPPPFWYIYSVKESFLISTRNYTRYTKDDKQSNFTQKPASTSIVSGDQKTMITTTPVPEKTVRVRWRAIAIPIASLCGKLK